VRFFPYTTIAGGFIVLAILISTWWVQGMRVTLQAGVPWLILLSVGYFTWARKQEQVVQTQIGRQESFRLPGRPIG
jgi:L-asparagine transporter-like permease